MGWYFRKPINFGPLRVNLSKSGIGFSLGVKGARIGAGPRGPYVAGGRGGIYFRKSLNARKTQSLIQGKCAPLGGYCTQCGNPISSGNRFCTQCGAGLTLGSSSAKSEEKHDHHVNWFAVCLIALMIFLLFKVILGLT